MASLNDISRVSPYPFVNLGAVALPIDGAMLVTSKTCKRNFNRSSVCRDHYAAISAAEVPTMSCRACPFGLASVVVRSQAGSFALTGFVPFPRIGGPNERVASRAERKHHIAIDEVQRAASALVAHERQFQDFERRMIERYSMALHEIRKLNRTVKQTAEGLCLDESPDDPDNADPKVVRIWKASELMSSQFDIIEILANESVAQLPLNMDMDVYRIFDKCVRIFRTSSTGAIHISTRAAAAMRIRACDKTFPIIPTVLIGNAIKYSVRGTPIHVEIRPTGLGCAVRVENTTMENAGLTQDIFRRGVRASSDTDGSGNGLYVARLIATQHAASISMDTKPLSGRQVQVAFEVSFPRTI